jgi:hypothetical protein
VDVFLAVALLRAPPITQSMKPDGPQVYMWVPGVPLPSTSARFRRWAASSSSKWVNTWAANGALARASRKALRLRERPQ